MSAFISSTLNRAWLTWSAIAVAFRSTLPSSSVATTDQQEPCLERSVRNLEGNHAICELRGVDLLALDAALARLETLEPRVTRLVELRFFAGLTVSETAAVLGVSPATVKRDWSLARAWLHRELSGRGPLRR